MQRRTIPGRLAALAAALLLAAHSPAHAEWYAFDGDPPEALTTAGMLVGGWDGTITLSFLGDCTLGGVPRAKPGARSFEAVIAREGMDYPFRGLLPLTAADDVTVVNLEGVLTDRALTPADKDFTFRGETAYAQILALGSVELACLCNNHTMDFGPEGYADTLDALAAAGVAACGADTAAVWARDGVLIGFTGSDARLSQDETDALRDRMAALRRAGCQVIVHSMHGGVEYAYTPAQHQRDTARTAIALGADLVVGHHPHVVQDIEWIDGVPVAYSLGNAVFGGNVSPRDQNALLLRVELDFAAGELTDLRLDPRPIRISSNDRYNDYCPQQGLRP